MRRRSGKADLAPSQTIRSETPAEGLGGLTKRGRAERVDGIGEIRVVEDIEKICAKKKTDPLVNRKSSP